MGGFSLFCQVLVAMEDEHTIDGDLGGIEQVGKDREVEPRADGPKDPKSIELIEPDAGEGIAEPVAAYKGRSSSGL